MSCLGMIRKSSQRLFKLVLFGMGTASETPGLEKGNKEHPSMAEDTQSLEGDLKEEGRA